LGLALGQGRMSAALHSLAAFAGYICGVAGAALAHKVAVVQRAVDRHGGETEEPFELLRRYRQRVDGLLESPG
jgi:NaMN:DMB phosphoribosyltransferase